MVLSVRRRQRPALLTLLTAVALAAALAVTLTPGRAAARDGWWSIDLVAPARVTADQPFRVAARVSFADRDEPTLTYDWVVTDTGWDGDDVADAPPLAGCVVADPHARRTEIVCDAAAASTEFSIWAQATDEEGGAVLAGAPVNRPEPERPQPPKLSISVTPGFPTLIEGTLTRDGVPLVGSEGDYVALLHYGMTGRKGPAVAQDYAIADADGRVEFRVPINYYGMLQQVALQYVDDASRTTVTSTIVPVKTPLKLLLTHRTGRSLVYELHDSEGNIARPSVAMRTKLQAAPGSAGPWRNIARRTIGYLADATYPLPRRSGTTYYRAVAPGSEIRATAISKVVRVRP